jgi:hypothetical protein
MYDKVYDELNRCRDWPIKILGFTSGLYITALGFLKIFDDKVNISKGERNWIITWVCIFCGGLN